MIYNYKASHSESSLNIRKDIVIVIVMVTRSHTLNNIFPDWNIQSELERGVQDQHQGEPELQDRRGLGAGGELTRAEDSLQELPWWPRGAGRQGRGEADCQCCPSPQVQGDTGVRLGGQVVTELIIWDLWGREDTEVIANHCNYNHSIYTNIYLDCKVITIITVNITVDWIQVMSDSEPKEPAPEPNDSDKKEGENETKDEKENEEPSDLIKVLLDGSEWMF